MQYVIGFERVRNAAAWLATRLWLIPSILSVVGLMGAYTILSMNLDPETSRRDAWWLFSGDAETARNLLSTLLAGLISMTSLVVSITIVVLSLAAGQLGPRIIWNFIGDRTIQSVIGLFLGTILYTLTILRSIDETLSVVSSPRVAVGIASVGAGNVVEMQHRLLCRRRRYLGRCAEFHDLNVTAELLSPAMVEKDVTRDGVEPRTEVGSGRELTPPGPRAQEGFLKYILGVCRIPRQRMREGANAREMARDEA